MSEDTRKDPSKLKTVATELTRNNDPVTVPTNSTPGSGSNISSSQHDKKDGLPSEETDISAPQTEVSTSPSSSSEENETDIKGTFVDGGAVMMSVTPQTTSSSGILREDTDGANNDVDDSELMHPLIMMSQTDQHIRQLDRHGELNEVAGSQSMLSQELMYHVSSQQEEEEDHEGSENDGDCEDAALSRNAFHLSQQTETSIGMAQRLGLLSQTQDDYDDDDDVEEGVRQGNHDEASAHRDTATKGHINGLDLLTRAGSNEAATLMSFSQEFPTMAVSREKVELSDTPLRESEGFGSLLDAVAKITEQEEVDEILTPTWENNMPSLDHASLPPSRDETYLDPLSSSMSAPQMNVAASSGGDVATRKRQVRKTATAKQERRLNESNQNASTSRATSPTKSSQSKTSKSSPPSKKRKAITTTKTDAAHAQKMDETERKKESARLRMEQKEDELEVSRAQAEAKRAADLAERTISDPVIAKRLLLSMALVRENPRSVPDVLPGPGHVLQEGFFWAHYPPLEMVLKRHMMEYYELSTTKCQSAQQQSFNNEMVLVVQAVCESQGWKFADCFDSKGLRDRIRCYYKTHIQNAKKRLRTMVRNPTKRANARHLCEHLDLIEKHKVASELGGTNESPQPKRKKQRGDDDDHPTIQKDQKLAAKSTSDAGTSLRHGFTGGNVASDCEIRDNSSIASAQHTPTAEIEDKETPTMTVDPWVTPKESHGHESVEGITTPRPSTRSSTRQSANVANGTRRSKKMMTPPLSPLLI